MQCEPNKTKMKTKMGHWKGREAYISPYTTTTTTTM